VAGEVGVAQGNHHPSIAPYGLFKCRGGAIQIAVGSDGLWHKFCALVGMSPETPEWRTNGDRVANRDSLIARIESAFSLTDAETLLAELGSAGIPAGKVRSIREVYEWEQTHSQGLLTTVDHETLGAITLPGAPLRFFDESGAEVTRRSHSSPPTLGQHSDLIRAEVKGLG
jgi:crotonobetainyl-CoA:carnitine CoA-transferase CaiB-like acyl-CoA transferase